MDKPYVGYDKEYSKNYDRIFRKSLLRRIKDFIDKLLIDLLIKENK